MSKTYEIALTHGPKVRVEGDYVWWSGAGDIAFIIDGSEAIGYNHSQWDHFYLLPEDDNAN